MQNSLKLLSKKFPYSRHDAHLNTNHQFYVLSFAISKSKRSNRSQLQEQMYIKMVALRRKELCDMFFLEILKC